MADESGEAATSLPSGEEGISESAALGAAHASSDSTACAAGDEVSLNAAASSSITKHPLHNSWCLWALLRDQSAKANDDNWHGSQMKVFEFDTVEDFWRLINHTKRPSKLGAGDFSMFKKDIAPAWEDETCKHGGRWIAKLEAKTPAQDFDRLWIDLLLTIIGENFAETGGSMVCGAVASARAKGSPKVALWVSERQKEKVLPIGRAFEKVLQRAVAFSGDIHFEDFSQSGKAVFSLAD